MTSHPVKRNSTGASTMLKVFILVASLGGMIGGWALLAAGQLAEAVSAARQAPAIVQPVRPSLQESAPINPALAPTPAPAPRQVIVPNDQTRPRALGRTRSSR